MNGFSAQTLALFLVLTPGFLFLAGTYFAPQRYPTRIDPQRGVIIDTALFVGKRPLSAAALAVQF